MVADLPVRALGSKNGIGNHRRRRVSNMFGVDVFPDEGRVDHSLHTAIIDRQGKLVANIEGNQFTAEQLGDLVRTVLAVRDAGSASTRDR